MFHVHFHSPGTTYLLAQVPVQLLYYFLFLEMVRCYYGHYSCHKWHLHRSGVYVSGEWVVSSDSPMIAAVTAFSGIYWPAGPASSVAVAVTITVASSQQWSSTGQQQTVVSQSVSPSVVSEKRDLIAARGQHRLLRPDQCCHTLPQ